MGAVSPSSGHELEQGGEVGENAELLGNWTAMEGPAVLPRPGLTAGQWDGGMPEVEEPCLFLHMSWQGDG